MHIRYKIYLPIMVMAMFAFTQPARATPDVNCNTFPDSFSSVLAPGGIPVLFVGPAAGGITDCVAFTFSDASFGSPVGSIFLEGSTTPGEAVLSDLIVVSSLLRGGLEVCFQSSGDSPPIATSGCGIPDGTTFTSSFVPGDPLTEVLDTGPLIEPISGRSFHVHFVSQDTIQQGTGVEIVSDTGVIEGVPEPSSALLLGAGLAGLLGLVRKKLVA